MIDLFIQRYDRNLLVFLCILAIIGTVMLYSASWYESFSSSNGRTDMLFLQNHLKRLLVGVFFLFGFLTIDYRKLKEIAPYLIAFSILLLIVTKLFLVQTSKMALCGLFLNSNVRYCKIFCDFIYGILR